MDAATSATDSSPPSRRRPAPCEESTSPCPAAGASARDDREEKGDFLSESSVKRHVVGERAGARARAKGGDMVAFSSPMLFLPANECWGQAYVKGESAMAAVRECVEEATK